MKRLLLVLLLVCPVLAQKPPKADAILELQLPESAPPPPGHPERVSKLVINGKDYTKPRLAKRTIAITRGPGGKVEIEYTFWPLAYMRVIRKRSLKAEAGATVKLDLRKPDKADKLWVIYVPTPMKVVREMCKLAAVKKGDVVYDIGCGDGRLVITAVKEFGAKKGVGIDLLADRVMQSKANAKKDGVADKITFLQKDALTIKDFSEADVVLLYMSDELNEKLLPALLKTMKKGSRIVSHRFRMGKWEPEKTVAVEAVDVNGREDLFRLHLWTVGKGKP
jgi:SAM-dependent methyltransferase